MCNKILRSYVLCSLFIISLVVSITCGPPRQSKNAHTRTRARIRTSWHLFVCLQALPSPHVAARQKGLRLRPLDVADAVMLFPEISRGLTMKLKVLVTDLPGVAQNSAPRTRMLRHHGGHVVNPALDDEPAIVRAVVLCDLRHGQDPLGPVCWRRRHRREPVRYFTVGLDLDKGATAA
jgi:hypothetical protein